MKLLLYLQDFLKLLIKQFFFSEGGFGDSLRTQSLISGVWSCAYSLGEVIGPALGGALLENCDFPTTATTMAAINLTTGIISGAYFLNRKRVHVKCEEKGAQENVQTSGNNEFSIFTVEDKLVARSGSICKIENWFLQYLFMKLWYNVVVMFISQFECHIIM